MVESPVSCSALAQERGDPLAGSAFSETRVLFVEQPGPWGHSGLTESHLDADVARHLEARAAAADVRLLAIRLPGRTPAGHVRRWLIADGRGSERTLVGGTFRADRELLDLDLGESADPADLGGAPVDGPMYFVCAHSKRDVCCALRGRAVAAALEALRPGRVYECAHLGGHRFAANVLVAPSGMLYGYVDAGEVESFVDAAEAGVVLPELLRGRLGLAPAAQAALAFGYTELGISEYDGLSVSAVTPRAERRADVTLRSAAGEYTVPVSWETRDVFGTSCAKPWPATIEAYQPLGITAVR